MNTPIINGHLFLFIGGTRDGQRLPADLRATSVELPMPGVDRTRPGIPVPTEIYQRMRWTQETEDFDVFALRGISGNSILRALIANYVTPAKPVPASPSGKRKAKP